MRRPKGIEAAIHLTCIVVTLLYCFSLFATPNHRLFGKLSNNTLAAPGAFSKTPGKTTKQIGSSCDTNGCPESPWPGVFDCHYIDDFCYSNNCYECHSSDPTCELSNGLCPLTNWDCWQSTCLTWMCECTEDH